MPSQWKSLPLSILSGGDFTSVNATVPFSSAPSHPTSLPLVSTGSSGPYQPIFIEALSTEAAPLSSAQHYSPDHCRPNHCRVQNQYVQNIICLTPSKTEMKPGPQRQRGSIYWHIWEIKKHSLESHCQLH